MMNTETAGLDLLALLAEVEAPDFLEKNPGVARAMAAYAAETAAREHASARRRNETANACPRCRGAGHIAQFRHVSGGDCFACAGSGVRGGNL